ncbi:MAG TPA: DUF362 domain-containing protein [Aggregatilineaceae bacterium]|nr:DUF362 domain-containing protein [Aggregatilineaceae bacterium]
MLKQLTRRTFLKGTGALAGGVLVGTPTETIPRIQANKHTSQAYQVALAQADSYEREVVRERVFTMIEQLGGLGDVVQPGNRVAIKINLTGGTWVEQQLEQPAVETMVTHPEVTRALVEAVLEAGASEVYIVEAIADLNCWSLWGSAEIAEDFEQVKLIDLNNPRLKEPFVDVPVGENWLLYDQFKMHPILKDVDVFMSVAKLKCHATAGVTLSMKNLVGTLPASLYMLTPADSNRSALHGYGKQAQVRIPSVVMDLVRARPIHFALIDGIKTAEGSEGPWTGDFNQKIANTLVAGKNMVATDAVAAAVMGFDPMAASFAEVPFQHCLNHLQLAAELGLGSNNPDDIDIVGMALDEVQTTFRAYGG